MFIENTLLLDLQLKWLSDNTKILIKIYKGMLGIYLTSTYISFLGILVNIPFLQKAFFIQLMFCVKCQQEW